MKTERVAKVLVLNAAGQVLLLRRSKDDPRRPGDWDYPGGGVEDGEEFASAAAREIAEEAGLSVQVSNLKLIYMGTEYYEPADLGYNRCLYVVHLQGDETIRLSMEHDHYEWMDVNTALVEFKHPFYNAGLRYARDHDLL